MYLYVPLKIHFVVHLMFAYKFQTFFSNNDPLGIGLTNFNLFQTVTVSSRLVKPFLQIFFK